jgi:hypothetical protein
MALNYQFPYISTSVGGEEEIVERVCIGYIATDNEKNRMNHCEVKMKLKLVFQIDIRKQASQPDSGTSTTDASSSRH